MAAICQQLLEHAAKGLHAGCVVLVKLGLELALQATDRLLWSLLVSGKTTLQGEQALVQKSAHVVDAAVKLLSEGVELRLDVAHSLGLLHSRAVLLAQLELHVLDEVGEAGLEIDRADCQAAQIEDVTTHSSLHGIHIHAEKLESLAQVRGKALFGLKSRIE